MADSFIKRVLSECDLLAWANRPRCLCINQTYFAGAELAGCSTRQALREAVVCEMKHPVVYVVLALPPLLCGTSGSVDALLAFVLPPAYPFKPPSAYMLTKGVFMPSSPCRGSEGRPRLLKVSSLWEEVASSNSARCERVDHE